MFGYILPFFVHFVIKTSDKKYERRFDRSTVIFKFKFMDKIILLHELIIILSMNLNLKMTLERSKRRSYFLSLVFITKCFTKNLLLRIFCSAMKKNE